MEHLTTVLRSRFLECSWCSWSGRKLGCSQGVTGQRRTGVHKEVTCAKSLERTATCDGFTKRKRRPKCIRRVDAYWKILSETLFFFGAAATKRPASSPRDSWQIHLLAEEGKRLRSILSRKNLVRRLLSFRMYRHLRLKLSNLLTYPPSPSPPLLVDLHSPLVVGILFVVVFLRMFQR